MNIIWGYKADPHITAQQLRNTYAGIFGGDTHILDTGSKLAATVVSATQVDIADGVMIAQGCTASIEHGESESLTIANGSQGMLRKDLIKVIFIVTEKYKKRREEVKRLTKTLVLCCRVSGKRI